MRPLLEYRSMAWNHFRKAYMGALEEIQKDAVEFMPKFKTNCISHGDAQHRQYETTTHEMENSAP